MDITIDNFNGPLDLLLHLIKKDNINIFDIDITNITEKYLNYIKSQKELNLNISSEYLVMASELLEIKSNSLLPKQDIDNDEEENTKENLINRLIEYEQYKNITNNLKELKSCREDVFTREIDNLSKYYDDSNTDYSLDLDSLINAFKNLLNSNEFKRKIDTKITNKEYSIHVRSIEIKNIIKEKKQVNFIDLFETYNKDYIVITFLSILALTRKQEIDIYQDANFKNIIIKEKIINESSC